jgi:hypothetical protein
MGTCVPSRVIDHLKAQQSEIESLSLVSEVACHYVASLERRYVDLSAFTKLKRVSWIRLSSENELSSLHTVLPLIAHQLEELELDLVQDRTDFWPLNYLPPTSSFTISHILRSGGSRLQFPKLRVLSLSRLPLQNSARELEDALDFSNLHTLKLRRCNLWEDLLRCMTESERTIQLKTFELQTDHETQSTLTCYEQLAKFLRKFDGLEELFMLTAKLDTAELWSAILGHKSTLWKLMLHQMRVYGHDHYGPKEMEISDLSLHLEIPKRYWEQQELPMEGMNLEFIGLGCHPLIAVRISYLESRMTCLYSQQRNRSFLLRVYHH